MNAPIVTVFGGSGFVGRYIARRMAKAGWRVRVAVRRPNEAGFVRTFGVVGQVEPIQANIRDEASTRMAITGADAVVNCVGILAENGRQNFDAVQTEGAERIARLTAEAGISRLVHISAIGADPESESDYARTKAEGEAAILRHIPNAMILRPSIVFGHEDEFFNRFAAMTRISPVIPIAGSATRFQPVFVDDVAAAAEKGVTDGLSGIFELGGPEVATFRELIELMLQTVRRKRVILTMPNFAARGIAFMLSSVQFLSGGLIPNTTLTSDQITLLARDNVVADDAKSFADLGIKPKAMESVLGEYLYTYRPYGQYTELTASGSDLRD